MNVRNWPIDRIMQLPDHCFGRRWPISVSTVTLSAGIAYDISEAALPERCVIWQVAWFCAAVGGSMISIGLRLGDQLPVVPADFLALPFLLRDFGQVDGTARVIQLNSYCGSGHVDMRVPIQAAGRRLVGRFVEVGGQACNPVATIVISSFPTEVPDWLISG